MKTLLVTTPIRPIPTTFPPIGSLSLVKALRKRGVTDVEFFNIDANRPTYEQALENIRSLAPGVLGISAVVSTAYEYTKRLTIDVKRLLPDTLIVVGGSLAASAEILLRRTGVDICVVGEGERVLCSVVERAQRTRNPREFADIRGLVLLDANGELLNTGYEDALPREEIYDFDWQDLADSADVNMFIYDAYSPNEAVPQWFRTDPRSHETHRVAKKVASLPGAKGCVARCTFCHRWEKGIRYIPVDIIMGRLEELIEKYNVGFLAIVDENFGTDRRWLTEFCAKIQRYDVLWHVAGMRVNCTSPEYIAMMKAAGCTSILYGMETGSERMLKIMEKNVRLQDNYNALKWTVEAGLFTVIQLVVGMPGESPETIEETMEFCKFGATLSSERDPNDLSINYAQALPGTPLYEFARHKGLVGQSLDEEEAYLLRISDRNAHDEYTTLNFTNYPTLLCRTWRSRIQIETNYAFVKKYGIKQYRKVLLRHSDRFRWPERYVQARKALLKHGNDRFRDSAKATRDEGYFANPRRLVEKGVATDTVHGTKETIDLNDESRFPSLGLLLNSRKFGLAQICYPVLFYRLRHFLPLLIFARDFRRQGARVAFKFLTEYVSYRLFFLRRFNVFQGEHRSLRKVVDQDLGQLPGDHAAMVPLRKGR